MLITEKIILFMSIWISVSLLVTNEAQFEIFLILILIGFVIIKELTSPFIVGKIKFKLNLFILVFLLVFCLVIFNRIFEYVTS